MKKIAIQVVLWALLSGSHASFAGYDPSDVTIDAQVSITENGVKVSDATITTTNLKLEPVDKSATTVEFYCSLYGNSDNLKYYLSGQTKDEAWVKARLDTWSDRWAAGNPFTAFIIKKKDDGTPIGHVANGGGYVEGESSFAIVIDHAYRQKEERFGSEASNAILQHWVSFLHREKARVCEGVFQSVHASALVENGRSVAILERNGFKVSKEEPREMIDGKQLTERTYHKKLGD